MTRRQFMKLSAFTMALCATSLNFAKDTYAKAKDCIGARLGSIYKRDAEMKYRKSQDNPAVKDLYSRFLEEPLSEHSHHLLHTHYQDRSAGVKALKDRGVKLAV